MNSGEETGVGWSHEMICAVWPPVPVYQLPKMGQRQNVLSSNTGNQRKSIHRKFIWEEDETNKKANL